MRFLDTSHIRVRLDQHVKVTDGTRLSVDMYLPAEPGRYPVLVTRTPADNNRMNRVFGAVQLLPSAADRWKAVAAQGFIVATCDVRGRGDSDGDFVPFANEGADGAATVEWLRSLPECNGKVGAFGTGYAAFCAWAAIAAGARIDAIVSISPFGAVGEGLVHQGGAVRLDWLFWMNLIGGRTLQPASIPPWPRIHKHLPLSTMASAALGRTDTQWQQWMEHLDPSDAFWAPLQLADKLSQKSVPGLHITGWWDGQLNAARYYYEAAHRSGAPQSVVIGPWDTAAVRHPTMFVGGLDFGPRSLLDFDEALVQFFGAQLRGDRNEWAKPTSRVFVTGRNEWVEGSGWPRETGTRELQLSSEGAANTRRGDGLLGSSAGATFDEIVDNSDMPVEFQADFKSFAAGASPLSLEQTPVTARDEALVYTSAPLEQTLTISGRPSVTLTVRTDAADSDLFVLLSDVFPLGARDVHLSHSAVRLATRKEFRRSKPSTLTLQLNEVAHDFLPGHSVRITVVPSLFPLYARNTHQKNYATADKPAVVAIEIHHGGSRLKLPLGS